MIKRNTIQRALVLKAVNTLQCHATVEEIYSLVVKEYPNISKVTVYRNLNQLAENGEIRKLEVPGDADRFDHLCHDHYHARCLRCGRVFDVDMDYIEDLEKRIKDAHGFEFSGHDLMFKGICPDCKTKSQS
ncbi:MULTISPECIES: Fur family transcriptional regulator [Eubacteriales]|uniref:Fur family transcriptional regulator, ferric uptake regulator/Fur family transcriptional regulator, peroxide stress response regulator n=1 Tax=Bittarella massiliensis (ex Durand et al. 2017) TaxID=1720313 RepID=A0AAQ1RWK0_9FIRM|nr:MULTISPECIES: transcriptional repressor [Eubacteriales]ERJ01027.1 transcriptional regulator, Fur family [Clostridium sp. ATCC 29733]MZL70485.1 transcriptional repressor [Bittarella massiliensis (ex Durand et al. 2017)]MZL80282.1 transcriptional repressor [Bittarella massiliensis (ex Durand et al. 2017)]SHG34832.1 Fur family transcriptional regulator, ferric uptake regulator/Fur family transcriptional regulator, peroxide stress response regulator [Bittarella massiliensis (ex Durand et al. 201